MKNVIGLFAVSLSLFLAAPVFAGESCECPKLACDPCSVEKGITFFSAKCGVENEKVKSCGRPTCIPIDEATKDCPVVPASNSGPREPIVVSLPKVPSESLHEISTLPSVGRIKVIQGSVSIVHADGQKTVITKEGDVHETDTMESGKDSTAVVSFDGGNKMHLHEDTAVEVKEYKNAKVEESRKALFSLIKGKIRNQVEQKYNGKTSSYKVLTRGAVAGVRGTDFVIEHHEDKRMETKVESLGGRVILASLDEKQTREILRGEGARFVSDLPNPGFKDKDMSEFIQRGTMSPVYKISDEDLKALERSSRVDVARNKSKPSKESAICLKPKGFFNQCAWKCSGNPAGESKCRVDLPNVSCVRQRCNGNGKWAEETQVPSASARVFCPASGEMVKDCDY